MAAHINDMVPNGAPEAPLKPDGTKWNLNTQYEPSMCQTILDVFEQGGTLATACAAIGIGKQTFFKWCDSFEEFQTAYDMGMSLSETWWDNKAQKNLEWLDAKGQEQFRTEIWKFQKTAEFGAKDKADTTIVVDAGSDKLQELIKEIRRGQI